MSRLFAFAPVLALVFFIPRPISAAPPPVELPRAGLTIGDRAPRLDVAAWPVRRDEAGPAVVRPGPDGGEGGRVTVVEFWATWCGPCVANIPRLADLAEEYAGRVRFVAVSGERAATVDRFLDRPSPVVETDDEGERRRLPYRSVMSRYDVAVDPDGSTNAAYMTAALERGIPHAFVVDADGSVAWSGHPAELETVVPLVLDGTWDRDRFAARYAKGQERTLATREVGRLAAAGAADDAIALARWLYDEATSEGTRNDARERLLQTMHAVGRDDEAVAFAEAAIAAATDPVADWQARGLKYGVLLLVGRYDAAVATARSLAADVPGLQPDPVAASFVRWALWQQALQVRLATAPEAADGAEVTDDVVAVLGEIAALDGLEPRCRLRTAETVRDAAATTPGRDRVVAALVAVRPEASDADAVAAFDELLEEARAGGL